MRARKDRRKNFILRKEAGQRRNAGNGQRRQRHRCGRGGHVPGQSTHVPEILWIFVTMRVMIGMMHRVNHRASTEEQQRFEERVRDQVEHASGVCAAAHRHEHVPQLRDGGVRQHLLDVPLAQRDRGGEQRRERANGGDHQRGFGRTREDRRGTRHEVHTGGHHGGGVNQCRHGCRTRHRVGQPDVQWQLRALAGAADEQEEGDGQNDRRTGHAAERDVRTHEVEPLRGDPDQEHGD